MPAPRTSIGVVGSLAQGIAEFASLVDAEHDAIMQGVTTRVSNGLVRDSLVDTGDMVADWDVAVGNWPSDTHQPADPGKRTTRQRLKTGFRDVKIGQAVFFENDDPAAIQQELGHLRRQPNGLARLQARRFAGYVRGEAIAAQTRIKKTLSFD